MARTRTGGRHRLRLEVLPQPDLTTCGPTCLHAIYDYYGDPISLDTVVREVATLPGGGTLAVWLACHALRRGFRATIYTYNLQLFDPTWFAEPGVDISAKLEAQLAAKPSERLAIATGAYQEFFQLGGRLKFKSLTPELLRRPLIKGVPVLTGLSATYLYGCARERNDDYDDVAGRPTGHFVVVNGFDTDSRKVQVSDPLHDNPRYGTHTYRVRVERLIGAILLGIVTYDANLLLITPPRGAAKDR
ncbi:MAG: hypothetical protein AB7O67_16170 [Vicinamibacterales bacterium]